MAKEKVVVLEHKLLHSEAFKALSVHASLLYLYVHDQWHPTKDNNGELVLPYRKAADELRCSLPTVGKAFKELQAKGFLVVHGHAVQSADDGKRMAPRYEVTAIAMPGGVPASELYLQWPDHGDFEVVKGKNQNPKGVNKKTETSPTPLHRPVQPRLTGGEKTVEIDTEKDGSPVQRGWSVLRYPEEERYVRPKPRQTSGKLGVRFSKEPRKFVPRKPTGEFVDDCPLVA